MLQSIKNIYHWIMALGAVLFYRYPARSLVVIGVTGTDGKTTTATMIYSILRAAKFRVALISTVAAYIGDEAIDTGFHVTTPNSWSLQKLIRQIVDRGYTHLVIEATSHGLDQHRLFGVNISQAVVTNVTQEHLDYHKTYSRYLLAKAKILKHVSIAVLNADDASFDFLKKQVPAAAQTYAYSLVKPTSFSNEAKKYFKESYNQANAVAALTLAYAQNIPLKIALHGLKNFSGVSGRMEAIANNRDLQVVVDFAHTPNALHNALVALRKESTGKLIAVFGAAGERDPYKRPQMGKIAANLADEVVLTSEDPRSEDARSIIATIKSGATVNRGHLHAILDRQAAIHFAINHLAKAGDTIGIFGKGHERSLNLDGKHEIPWSDQDVARTCLENEDHTRSGHLGVQ